MLSLAASVLAGCGGDGVTTFPESLGLAPAITSVEEARTPGKWTVLVYIDGDNDLEYYALQNMNQMEEVGSSRDARIVVQVDRAAGYDKTEDDWTDTRRYLMIRDVNPDSLNSVRLDDPPMGELDMADWHNLHDFVQWGKANFPAEHYCLVVWDHGSGWEFGRIAAMPPRKYILIDDATDTVLNIDDLARALEGTKLDVVAFDACFMMQLEVAYELKDCTTYMAGSAAATPSAGYNYAAWLRRVGSTTSPLDLTKILTDEFMATYPPPAEAIAHSAIDLRQIGGLAAAASSFATILLDNASTKADQLASARTSALNYSRLAFGSERYIVDLVDYASIARDAVGPDAGEAYSALVAASDRAVVYERHNPDTPTAHGLGIYVPGPRQFDTNYARLLLASDTNWDEWIAGQTR